MPGHIPRYLTHNSWFDLLNSSLCYSSPTATHYSPLTLTTTTHYSVNHSIIPQNTHFSFLHFSAAYTLMHQEKKIQPGAKSNTHCLLFIQLFKLLFIMKFKLLFLLPLFGMSLNGYSQQPVSATGGLNFENGNWMRNQFQSCTGRSYSV
jgi:hypothetical protein